MKTMNMEEGFKFLHDSGLLFEINRLILHPVGLSFGIRLVGPKVNLVQLLQVENREDIYALLFSGKSLEHGEGKIERFVITTGIPASNERYETLGIRSQDLASDSLGINRIFSIKRVGIAEEIDRGGEGGLVKSVVDNPGVVSERELKDLMEKHRYISLSEREAEKKKEIVNTLEESTVDMKEEDVVEESKDIITVSSDNNVAPQEKELIREKKSEDMKKKKLVEKYGKILHPRLDGKGMHTSVNIDKESIPGGGSMVICLDCGYVHRDSDI